jgi:branched-chain amino acid transport system permease protein
VTAESPTARSSAEVAGGRVDGRLIGWSKLPLLPVAVVVVLVALVPVFITSSYLIDVLILILIYAILNQGWNLALGMLGAWNFGQLALYAIGGYGAGIACVHLGLSPWLGLPIGVIAAAVANLIIAIPSMRLRGVYVAILTFSFAEVLSLVIVLDKTGFTGGSFGLSGVPGLFDGYSSQTSQRLFFWLCLALCVGTALLIRLLMNSPYGVAFHALRDSTRYAASLGISMRTYYILGTTIAAALAGLAGALYIFQYSTIAPGVMGMDQIALFLFMIMIGGLGTFTGPILGTFVYVVLNQYLTNYGNWQLFALGTIVLIVVVVQPRGLVPLLSRILSRARVWVNEDQRTGSVAEPPPDPDPNASRGKADEC